MTPEQIVLIIALFGSAKAALDVVVSAVKAVTGEISDKPAQETAATDSTQRLLKVLESMTLANEKLAERVAALEAAATVKRASRKTTKKPVQDSNEPPLDGLLQMPPPPAEAAQEGGAFEVVH